MVRGQFPIVSLISRRGNYARRAYKMQKMHFQVGVYNGSSPRFLEKHPKCRLSPPKQHGLNHWNKSKRLRIWLSMFQQFRGSKSSDYHIYHSQLFFFQKAADMSYRKAMKIFRWSTEFHAFTENGSENAVDAAFDAGIFRSGLFSWGPAVGKRTWNGWNKPLTIINWFHCSSMGEERVS